ncbi:1116_t:CDS:2 [Entrophospora sp. SA101]|nr:1116_t:CDS:2 [Entrophospora sp. SA101]
MPSQSNEVLSFQTYHPDSNSSSHLSSTCSEGGDSLFQEENGKYDLDTVSTFVAKLYQQLNVRRLFSYVFILVDASILNANHVNENNDGWENMTGEYGK